MPDEPDDLELLLATMPDMKHVDAKAAGVEPRRTKRLVWRFLKADVK